VQLRWLVEIGAKNGQFRLGTEKGYLTMSRISSMTIGLVLIFLGAQLYLVKSYLLTPTATRFVQEHFSSNNDSMFAAPSLQGNGLLTSNGSGNGGNGFSVGNWNAGNASIGQAPAGQKWPYYQTGSSSNAGQFANSSFRSPATNGGGVNTFGSGFNTAAVSGGGSRFVPPRWIMWPALFLGVVFFLHGVALRG